MGKTRQPGLLSCAAVVVAAGATGSATADDWLQWRGPNRAGISTETGLLDEWPPEGPAVNWQIETLGSGYGPVVVRGERLYVQGTRQGQSVVFCLRTSDGGEVWERRLGPLYDHPDRGDGPRSAPTLHDGAMYVQNGMGELARLDPETGEVAWQFNILERFGSPNTRWGISESPLVVRDRIFVMPGGQAGAIAALDTADGSTIWRSTELGDVASYSSLILREVAGTEVLLGFTGEAGVGVRAEDGALLWRYTRPSTGNAINVTTPVFANDQVFYSASYGIGGGALRISPAGASEAGPPTSAAPSGTTAASTPGAPNPSGTLWAGEGGSRGLSAEEAWFETRLQNHHGGVVVHEGTMYAFFGPALTSVDFESGQVHWRARSVGKGSLVMADGKLFLLGERNQVGLAVATPNGYEERGRFEIEDRGDFTWAHPVVAGGALYIRDQESLTSYDVAASEAAAETGASE